MQHPRYDGVIEQWKVDLMKERARWFRFQPADLPDAVQDLVMALFELEYDPDHASGADEHTFWQAAIDNCLKLRQRATKRYKMALERAVHRGHAAADEVRTKDADLAMDVATALELLPLPERRLCALLKRGYSKAMIARRWGTSWGTVDRMARKVRAHFEKHGIGKWVER